MVDRDLLLFEIGFYESKIAYFRELIDIYEKNIEEVRGELCTLDGGLKPQTDIQLIDFATRQC